MAWSKHKAVNEYIAAKERGDTETTDRIVHEVGARFSTRTTDGTEITDLYWAAMGARSPEED
jgi:hypothetical protein